MKHENKVSILQNAIEDGLKSGVAENFEPKSFLEELKARK